MKSTLRNLMATFALAFATTVAVAQPGSFMLLTPEDDATVSVTENGTAMVSFTWSASVGATEYLLLIGPEEGNLFTDFIFVDTEENSYEISSGTLDSLANVLQVEKGDTIELIWTVIAFDENDDEMEPDNGFFAIHIAREQEVSVAENIFSNSIKTFPNPAQNTVMVELPNAQRTNLRVLNAQGQVVAERVLTQQLNTVDVSGFNTGLYFFQLQQQGGMATKPVQVVR